MTAHDVTSLLAKLPKEQRYDAGAKIRDFERRGFTEIRLFDRMGDDGEFDKHDLIGRHPKSGETTFLFKADGL